MHPRMMEKAKQQFVVKESAKYLSSQQGNTPSVIPKGLLGEKAKVEAESEWEAMQAPLRKGVDVFLRKLEWETPLADKEKIYAELENLNLYLEKKAEEEQELENVKVDCELDNLMEAMYQCAKDLVKNGSFQHGAALFRILTILSPHIFDFWMGYGIAQQESGLLQQAILAYKTAKELYPEHPLPGMYLAETYALQKEFASAQEVLNHAFELIRLDKSSQFQCYVREAQEIQNKIRR